MSLHVLSVDQFDTTRIQRLFKLTRRIENDEQLFRDALKGMVSTNLFYEASTRTSSSFLSAVAKLGGSVIPINDVTYSSVSKGETLEDTIRTLACYSDFIVLRHPEKGAAQRAAAVSPVPIINGGDGAGEHPTQALLDLYTILKHVDISKPFSVALMGDLRNGRTVHSLVKLLRQYDATIHLVSPPSLSMPFEYKKDEDHIHQSIDEIIGDIDVLYMTRVQKERMNAEESYEDYGITIDDMAKAKSSMILMHPLPRVNEIDRRIDNDPRAVYFEQMKNGLYVRMAIFISLLNQDNIC